MGKAGAGLAQLGVSISQSGAAFSQLCLVVSQVSLAISQSSLVLGQFSVTVSQFIIAFSQISVAVSHYVFIISQFGSLVIQVSVALKKLSDGISNFGKEVQRFSVIMVQFSVAFRHVAVTVSHLTKAFKIFVISLRTGKIPWVKVCVVVRQLSEAVRGFGVALGEVSAILSIFTTLNAQLVRVAYLHVVSQKTCLILLQYASRVRKLSVGIAQLSGAIFQLSITCKHITLMVQQWLAVKSLVLGSFNIGVKLCTAVKGVLKCIVNIVERCFHCGYFLWNKLFVSHACHVGKLFIGLAQSCVDKVEDYFFSGLKSAYKSKTSAVSGILQKKTVTKLPLFTHIDDINKVAYVTLMFPREPFSACFKISKSLNDEIVSFPNRNTITRLGESEIYMKYCFVFFLFKTKCMNLFKSTNGLQINNYFDEFPNILYKCANQDVDISWTEKEVFEENHEAVVITISTSGKFSDFRYFSLFPRNIICGISYECPKFFINS